MPTPPRRRQPGTSARPRAIRACLSRLPGKRARPVLKGGPRRGDAPGLPDEAQLTALRYFALDGTDHATYQEQASMIRRYIIWRNNYADDERAPPCRRPRDGRLNQTAEPGRSPPGR
jgi:hypothetical protein